MKKFLLGVGRFFVSWTFLKIILWITTLIIFFYVEEDWRGARTLAATKAKWLAKGESFDVDHFIPPPVPEEQNLGAIPLFKLEPDPQNHGLVTALVLRQATHQDLELQARVKGNSQEGELPDLKAMQKDLTEDYGKVFKSPPPTQDSLALLDALYPFTADLRAAAASRPYCRFQQDYTSQPAYARGYPLLVGQLKIAKILTLHAVLALNEHQPEVALADLKTLDQLTQGVYQEPTIISGLVANAMIGVGTIAFYDGLALHAWNNSQLAELQASRARFDTLTSYQYAIRSEVALFTEPSIEYTKKHRPPIGLFFGFSELDSHPLSSADLIFRHWPGGWLDFNLSKYLDGVLMCVSFADPIEHRAYPKQADSAEKKFREFDKSWEASAPWNIFYVLTASYVGNLPLPYFQTQVRLDETEIACALERYRLAHGHYPDSLSDFTTAHLLAVPHDPMNGQPYHYQLKPEGTFLLYSVGWNQKDDGGVAVFISSTPGGNAKKEGDWVWPPPHVK